MSLPATAVCFSGLKLGLEGLPPSLLRLGEYGHVESVSLQEDEKVGEIGVGGGAFGMSSPLRLSSCSVSSPDDKSSSHESATGPLVSVGCLWASDSDSRSREASTSAAGSVQRSVEFVLNSWVLHLA